MTPAHPCRRPAIVLLALLGGPGAALADVRTESPKIAALMTTRPAGPRAFVRGSRGRCRHGIVYVKTGRRGRARACLLHQVTVADDYRLLTIVIDPERSVVAVMAAIAHELQHALEVVGNARIMTDERSSLFTACVAFR